MAEHLAVGVEKRDRGGEVELPHRRLVREVRHPLQQIGPPPDIGTQRDERDHQKPDHPLGVAAESCLARLARAPVGDVGAKRHKPVFDVSEGRHAVNVGPHWGFSVTKL